MATDPTRIDYGVELELGDGKRDSLEPTSPRSETITTGVASDAIRGVPLPRPSGTMARPSRPEPEQARDTHAGTEQASRDGVGAARQIVVPVKLPPGGNYEIVIRIELDTHP